jgi:hypothetical protein
MISSRERPEQGATVVAKAFYFAQKVATIASKISCTNLSTSQELTARSSQLEAHGITLVPLPLRYKNLQNSSKNSCICGNFP